MFISGIVLRDRIMCLIKSGSHSRDAICVTLGWDWLVNNARILSRFGVSIKSSPV